MSQPARLPRYTWRDYVTVESDSGVKHEYLDGHIYAMAGGSPEHAERAVNVATALNKTALRNRPCRVFSSDLRIRVAATGLGTYPDVSVVCGDLVRDPDDTNTVLNPTLLVEILSPTTAEYDRNEKLAHYRRIESVREILLVAHDQARVTVWRRQANENWTPSEHDSGDTVYLTSLSCELTVDEIYGGTTLAESSA